VISTFAGAQFMNVFNQFYYSFSPKVAEMVGTSPILQATVRAFIYPLLASLRIGAAICQLYPLESQLMVLVGGVAASGMVGLVYGVPIAALFNVVRRTVKKQRRSLS
jgi:predicted PurR-regulated permease PerM